MTPFRKPAASANLASIAAEDPTIDWPALEALVHVDPAGRGLASYRVELAALDAGQLRPAALHLAHGATSVGIVTGFCVVAPEGVTAETDGPPGALFLAPRSDHAGHRRHADHRSLRPALVSLRPRRVEHRSRMPCRNSARDTSDVRGLGAVAADWVATWQARGRSLGRRVSGVGAGQALTHVIAIERVGPSHTAASVAAQPGGNAAARDWFAAAVPAEDRDVCHNMRGESIDAWTAGAERLFAAVIERGLPITTIGIGDGGNEIGMGRYDWASLVEGLASDAAERIVCRVATDFALIAGVSNWAAYALALAVAASARSSASWGETGMRTSERHLIEQIVRRTTAVDGLTRRREPTVDGLPLDVYLRPLEAMRELLGYPA